MKNKNNPIQFRLEFENYDVAYNKIQLQRSKSKKPRPTKEQIEKTMESLPNPSKGGILRRRNFLTKQQYET